MIYPLGILDWIENKKYNHCPVLPTNNCSHPFYHEIGLLFHRNNSIYHSVIAYVRFQN